MPSSFHPSDRSRDPEHGMMPGQGPRNTRREGIVQATAACSTLGICPVGCCDVRGSKMSPSRSRPVVFAASGVVGRMDPVGASLVNELRGSLRRDLLPYGARTSPF